MAANPRYFVGLAATDALGEVRNANSAWHYAANISSANDWQPRVLKHQAAPIFSGDPRFQRSALHLEEKLWKWDQGQKPSSCLSLRKVLLRELQNAVLQLHLAMTGSPSCSPMSDGFTCFTGRLRLEGRGMSHALERCRRNQTKFLQCNTRTSHNLYIMTPDTLTTICLTWQHVLLWAQKLPGLTQPGDPSVKDVSKITQAE